MPASAIFSSATKSESQQLAVVRGDCNISVCEGELATWKGPDAIQEPNRMGNRRQYATLVQEADDPQEREYYARKRDAWITLAKRCEPFNVPDVTDSQK